MWSHCKRIWDLLEKILSFLSSLLNLRIVVDFLENFWSGNVFPFDVFYQNSRFVGQKRPEDQIDVQVIWVNLKLIFEIVVYEVRTPKKLLAHKLGWDHQNRGSDEVINGRDEAWVGWTYGPVELFISRGFTGSGNVT